MTFRLDFLEGVSLELNSSDYGEKFKALIQLQKYRVTLEEAQKYKFGRLVQNISKQDRPPSQSVAHELMSAWKAEEGASKKRKLVVSCTCSCVFYNGFLFMKYILAQGYSYCIAKFFFLMHFSNFSTCGWHFASLT